MRTEFFKAISLLLMVSATTQAASSDEFLPLSAEFQGAVSTLNLPIAVEGISLSFDGQRALFRGRQKQFRTDGSLQGKSGNFGTWFVVVDLMSKRVISERQFTNIKTNGAWGIATSNRYVILKLPGSSSIGIYEHDSFELIKEVPLSIVPTRRTRWSLIEDRYLCFEAADSGLEAQYFLIDLDKMAAPFPIAGYPQYLRDRWWIQNVTYSTSDWSPAQVCGSFRTGRIDIVGFRTEVPEYINSRVLPPGTAPYMQSPGKRIGYIETDTTEVSEETTRRLSITLAEYFPLKNIARVDLAVYDPRRDYGRATPIKTIGRNVFLYAIGDQIFWLYL
jgi:hypothetical protein